MNASSRPQRMVRAMGKPDTTERNTESATIVWLVRDLLVGVASTIEAATEAVDGAGEGAGRDVMAELMERLRLAGKDLGVPGNEEHSSQGGGVPRLDPHRTLEYGHTMGFKSNDIVLLVAPSWYGDKYLKLSSAPLPITLGNLSDFMLLRSLAMFARDDPGQFIRMPDLLDDLDYQCRGLTNRIGKPLPECLSEPVIWKSLNRLRSKISNAGGRDEIIETASAYNGGFRLSTPPWNIILVDPSIDEGQSP